MQREDLEEFIEAVAAASLENLIGDVEEKEEMVPEIEETDSGSGDVVVGNIALA